MARRPSVGSQREARRTADPQSSGESRTTAERMSDASRGPVPGKRRKNRPEGDVGAGDGVRLAGDLVDRCATVAEPAEDVEGGVDDPLAPAPAPLLSHAPGEPRQYPTHRLVSASAAQLRRRGPSPAGAYGPPNRADRPSQLGTRSSHDCSGAHATSMGVAISVTEGPQRARHALRRAEAAVWIDRTEASWGRHGAMCVA